MSASPQGEDYNPDVALKRLSASLEQPDKFAEIFCSAAKKQKEIDNILKDNIRELIKYDSTMREQVKGLLREIEQEDFKYFLKRGGSLLGTFVSMVLGSVITLLISKFKL